MGWIVGITVNREVALAMGCDEIIFNINITDYNGTCIEGLLVNDMANTYCDQCKNEGGSCQYFGLLHSFQVIEMISFVGPIITAGKDGL